MFERLINVHRTMTMLQNEAHLVEWRSVLLHLTDQAGLHGLLAGRCCRLLFDQAMLPADEVARRMGLALSPASEPSQAAAWLEGFLHGSGLLLLHNDALWQILDAWVVSLQTDTFVQLLPLLRRTFATFSTPERRQMGERVKRGSGVRGQGPGIGDQAKVDVMRANKVLPLAAQLLRFKWEETL
jgi:hypothetical protein